MSSESARSEREGASKDNVEPLIEIEVTHFDAHIFVALRGDLDVSTATQLRDVLTRLNVEGVSSIVLELTELSYVDSIGLAIWVTQQKRADRLGIEFLLSRPNPFVLRLLEVTGLRDFLHVVPFESDVPFAPGDTSKKPEFV